MPLPGKVPGALRPGQKRPAGTQCPDRAQEEQRERREPSGKGEPRRCCKKGGPAGKSPPKCRKKLRPGQGGGRDGLPAGQTAVDLLPHLKMDGLLQAGGLNAFHNNSSLSRPYGEAGSCPRQVSGRFPRTADWPARPGRQAFSLVYHSCETFLKGDYPQKYTHC